MNDNISRLQAEQERLLLEWRSIWEKKLERKKELIQIGFTIDSIRHDKLYRKLKKAQKVFSKKRRHLEIKINRKIALMEKKDNR